MFYVYIGWWNLLNHIVEDWRAYPELSDSSVGNIAEAKENTNLIFRCLVTKHSNSGAVQEIYLYSGFLEA